MTAIFLAWMGILFLGAIAKIGINVFFNILEHYERKVKERNSGSAGSNS